MGTDNQLLMDVMLDVRQAADLERLQAAGEPSRAAAIQASVDRLVARRVIPPSARTTPEAVRGALEILYRCEKLNNQALLKVLYKSVDPAVRSYISLVCRLWLIHPTESVVESMASSVQEVFGVHRQLEHANAAMELQVRWNGPDPFHADHVIRAVQAKQKFNFCRQSSNVRQAIEGTVITRHKNSMKPKTAAFRYS